MSGDGPQVVDRLGAQAVPYAPEDDLTPSVGFRADGVPDWKPAIQGAS